MSKLNPNKSDFSAPFGDKAAAKLLGHIEQRRSTQNVAATLAGAYLAIMHFDGVIGDLYVSLAADPAAGESMVVDVLKNGVSILSATKTINATSDDFTKQISLLPLVTSAGRSFVVGDVFTVSRTYTAGGGPAMTFSEIVIEPSVRSYDL